MGKHDTKRRSKEQGVVVHPRATRRVQVGEVLVQARTALREIVLGAGFQVLDALLEEDREALCGRRYEQSGVREAYRHGCEKAPVVLGGRKVRVKKPRVRSASGGEIPGLGARHAGWALKAAGRTTGGMMPPIARRVPSGNAGGGADPRFPPGDGHRRRLSAARGDDAAGDDAGDQCTAGTSGCADGALYHQGFWRPPLDS